MLFVLRQVRLVAGRIGGCDHQSQDVCLPNETRAEVDSVRETPRRKKRREDERTAEEEG